MDSGWVAAIASVASALVVAVTAIAAFAQIRHVRNANDITVYLRLVDRLDSPESTNALLGVDAFVETLANDPELRIRLTQPGPLDGDFREIGNILRFLEHLATLVMTGGVSESLILAEYADNIEHLWDRLAETIYLRRLAFGPYTGAAFEHLAMRAKDYLAAGEMARLYGSLRRDPRMANFTPPVV